MDRLSLETGPVHRYTTQSVTTGNTPYRVVATVEELLMAELRCGAQAQKHTTHVQHACAHAHTQRHPILKDPSEIL